MSGTSPPLTLCAGSLPRASFTELIGAARDAGFDAVSCWTRTYVKAVRREGLDAATMRRMLDDHGLFVSELEPTDVWVPAVPDGGRSERELTLDELFEVAGVLGARSVVAIDWAGPPLDPGAVVDAFGRLCELADRHGVRVALEAQPYTRISTTEAAWSIVEAAGHPAGGLLLDSWHHRRGGTPDEFLEGIPVDRIVAVQLADGPMMPEEDLFEETMWRRQPPGLGEMRLARLMRPLLDRGLRCPIGPELYDEEGDHRDPRVTARRLRSQLEAVLSPSAGTGP